MKALLLVVCFFLSSPAFAQEQDEVEKPAPPETQVELDTSLKNILNRKYPGFRLVRKSDYSKHIRAGLGSDDPKYQWSYQAIKADFDGNGLDDYTFYIRFRKNFRWLVALKKEQTYEIHDFGSPEVPEEDRPTSKTSKWVGMLLTTGPVFGLSEDFPYEEMVDWSEYPISSRWPVPLNPFPYIFLVGDGDYIQTYWKGGRWQTRRMID